MMVYKTSDGSEYYRRFSDVCAVFEKICHQQNIVEGVYLCFCFTGILSS